MIRGIDGSRELVTGGTGKCISELTVGQVRRMRADCPLSPGEFTVQPLRWSTGKIINAAMTTDAACSSLAVTGLTKSGVETHGIDHSVDVQSGVYYRQRRIHHRGMACRARQPGLVHMESVLPLKSRRAVADIVAGAALRLTRCGPYRGIGGVPSGKLPMTISVETFETVAIPLGSTPVSEAVPDDFCYAVTVHVPCRPHLYRYDMAAITGDRGTDTGSR